MKKFLALIILTSFCTSAQNKNEKQTKQLIEVNHSIKTPIIDGVAESTVWADEQWHPINQRWLGDEYTESDFSGRYKLVWDAGALYLLAEITDDKLRDVFKDPLKNWWDEDCLEIFVDEDNSGGEHQYNNNAFAYHVDLEGNVVDVDETKNGILYNSHVISARKTTGKTMVWETKVLLYDDSFSNNINDKPVKLNAEKRIGFALAYCDNDASEHRENFIGSIYVQGEDKNRGWIDASIFGTLVLKK